MMPRLIPGVLPTGSRRRLPKRRNMVPLWTPDPGGQLIEGVIRVPTALCNTTEHTNQRLKFNAWITANLERWVEWRRRKGWFIASDVDVAEPTDPPEGDRLRGKERQAKVEAVIGTNADAGWVDDFDYAQEYQWCVVQARFTREEPLYVGLEDMLFLRHLALKYEVDPDRDFTPFNPLPEPVDEIFVEGGEDPMQVAEARRQRLGLKREDYLFDDVWKPL